MDVRLRLQTKVQADVIVLRTRTIKSPCFYQPTTWVENHQLEYV